MAEISLATTVPILYEPKLKNRWTVEFPTDIGIQTFMMESFQRPTITINSKEIPFMNTSTYVSGRFTWGEMTMNIRDFIAPSTAQAVMEWVRLSSESATGRSGYASGYAKTLNLKLLDGPGVAVEQWRLQNCIITSADFGSLSYSDDELAMVSVTIQPQNCILLY